jgi:hypothetical protein
MSGRGENPVAQGQDFDGSPAHCDSMNQEAAERWIVQTDLQPDRPRSGRFPERIDACMSPALAVARRVLA